MCLVIQSNAKLPFLLDHIADNREFGMAEAFISTEFLIKVLIIDSVKFKDLSTSICSPASKCLNTCSFTSNGHSGDVAFCHGVFEHILEFLPLSTY